MQHTKTLQINIRFNKDIQMTFTAHKQGYILDVINSTISASSPSHLIGISLSPVLESGQHHLRLVMNWGARPMELDLHVMQIDKWAAQAYCTSIREAIQRRKVLLFR